MNFLNNPVVLCGGIALGIVLVLVIVVVICCKKSADKEREELKSLSEEIESNLTEEIADDNGDSKIEDVLYKMQEALDMKEVESVSFEQEQEENAIISYQELLNSLGAKNSIDINSIELYDDELDNQIEISDFNKEIIDSYQNDELSKEIYNFQNDYSNEAMPAEVVDESPVMNFDFSAENVEFLDDLSNDNEFDNSTSSHDVYEAKHVVGNKKFKRTEVISPVYGIIDEKHLVPNYDDVEEIVFDDNDSLLD